MANWKDKLLEMDMELEDNIDELRTLETEAKRKDVGVINPTSGGGLIAREDGTVEAFSDYGLGFRINPETQSFSIYAPNLKLFYQKKEEISFNTKSTFLKDEYEDVMQFISPKGESE